MINLIKEKYTIYENGIPVTNIEIEKLKKFSQIEIPLDYIELLKIASDIGIRLNEDVDIFIWGPESCINVNRTYSIQKYMPNTLAIGVDGGGNLLLYAEKNNKINLYEISYGNLDDIEEAVYLDSSLEEIFTNDECIKKILELF